MVWRAGSYAGSVGLYSCAEGERLALLKASKGGVSQVPQPQILTLIRRETSAERFCCWVQVAFAPDGLLLLASERKSDALLGWDIRQTRGPLFTCRRALTTNQRLQFDVDPCSCKSRDDCWDLGCIPPRVPAMNRANRLPRHGG